MLTRSPGGNALDDPDADFEASCTLTPDDLTLFEIDHVPVDLDPRGPAGRRAWVAVEQFVVTGPAPDDPGEASPHVRLEPYRRRLFPDQDTHLWVIRRVIRSRPDEPIWSYRLGDWDHPEDPAPADVARPFPEALDKARDLVDPRPTTD